MKTSPLIFAALLALAAGPVLAAPADGAKLFQEKTCWSCHGKDAKTPILPEYPKIAGQNAKYAEEQMLDIKTGARANRNAAAMKAILEAMVSDEEIKILAEYLSKLKP